MAAPIDLTSPCGRYLTFRDLVECGETWTASAAAGQRIDNLPIREESIAALVQLCRVVLDPVIEEFGEIELVYGFAGRDLSNRVKRTVGRVAPALDQHAAHEVNSKGKQICCRGGAAADFLVAGVSSREVAKWVVRNTEFDRLCFYDDSRPIHVSATDAPIGQIVEMRLQPSGRRTPALRSRDGFLTQL